jgi:TfoX/Sxy family transcriptional regulator of competence genes
MRPEMAIDEKLSGHVRAALAGADGVSEVKMFGGIGFMLNGNMVAAASDRGLLVRVGEAGRAEALARGAAPMIMNGRTMKGYFRITGKLDARTVKSWLRPACAFVETLPTKKAKAKSVRKSSKRLG